MITPERRRWLSDHVCGDCLASATGKAILSGAVWIATLSGGGEVDRCLFCGRPFVDDPAVRAP